MTLDTPLQTAPTPPPTVKVRVMVQHSPTLFSLLGLHVPAECPSALVLGAFTYYRSRSTDRWVFYKRAVSGSGEMSSTFDPRQQ